jgi:hypothetical protein
MPVAEALESNLLHVYAYSGELGRWLLAKTRLSTRFLFFGVYRAASPSPRAVVQFSPTKATGQTPVNRRGPSRRFPQKLAAISIN